MAIIFRAPSGCRQGRALGLSLGFALLCLGASFAADPIGSTNNLLSESAQRLADGDYEGAIRDASLAIQLDPKSAAAYEARGSIYIEEKLWSRAERDYAAAAKLSPDVVYKYKLAQIKFLQKSYEDAKPRFVALKSDPALGDLAIFKAFLCDLLGGHEAAAFRDLAECDAAKPAPSSYFCHAAWDLAHSQRAEAAKCFAAADQLYDHSVNERYIASLVESQRFQFSSATFTTRDGAAYTRVSVFMESAGLRVSTSKGWITLPLDQLPDDLSAFSEELRQQITRKRATTPPPPAPTSFVSFTTKAGRAYEHVRWSVDESGLSVLTANGWTSIPFSDLPADLSAFPKALQDEVAHKRALPVSAPVDPGPISFATKQGKTYHDVRATLVRDGVRVLTPDGWITIAFRDLPSDVSSFPADWQQEIQTRRAASSKIITETELVSFTTKKGVHYEQVRAAIEKNGLRLLTSDGLIAVPFNQLPADLSSFPEGWRDTISARLAEISKTKPAER